MEYADMADHISNKILEEHTPIGNQDKLKSYAADMLEALKYIHSKNVIHDDIKLENILLQSSERDDEYSMIKLCDFGLTHILDRKVGKAFMGIRCGTQGYMAPEQQANNWIGTEIDIWALGVVLYELAVAYKPTVVKDYRYGKHSSVRLMHT